MNSPTFCIDRRSDVIDFSQLQRDYATYLPAISRGYADAVIKPLRRNAPVSSVDLNFFDPETSLFYLPFALYSAGQADLTSKTPCNVSERDKTNTFVLGDSGGYQIIKGTLKVNGKIVKRPGDPERRVILDWLELHCDWAMTLDVPTDALKFASSGYTRFSDCLTDATSHLIYFHKHRKGNIKFLSCLHGRNKAECDLWYNGVRDLPFEGWAFAGAYKKNWYLVLHMLLRMRDEGSLEDKERLHFLGQSGLGSACILTSIQRALRKHINPNIIVSYDAASPFTQAIDCQVYNGYSLTPQRYSVSMERMPDAKAYIGSDIPFPWRSPIGERLTLGDLCVKKTGARAWDQVTDHMMMNHNLFMQMDAIIAANRVFELESGDAKKYCSERLLKIRDVIAKAFTEEDWDTFLERERRVLEISGKNEPEGLGARGDF